MWWRSVGTEPARWTILFCTCVLEEPTEEWTSEVTPQSLITTSQRHFGKQSFTLTHTVATTSLFPVCVETPTGSAKPCLTGENPGQELAEGLQAVAQIDVLVALRGSSKNSLVCKN